MRPLMTAPCSFMPKSSRPTVILYTAPVCSRPGKRVHLPGDVLVQAPAVVAHGVEVEMAAPFDVAEVGPRPEPLHRCFQQVSRTVEIEGVGRAHGQVHLAVEITPELRPVAAEVLGYVVVLLPIGYHG